MNLPIKKAIYIYKFPNKQDFPPIRPMGQAHTLLLAVRFDGLVDM